MKKQLFFWVVCFSLVGLFLAPVRAVSLTIQNKLYKGKPAKYIFLIIGDGMGITQRTLAEAFLNSHAGESKGRSLLMNRLPANGLTTTYAHNSFITDSAAAGTALAAGYKTNVGYVGMAPDLKPLESIVVKARKKGMKTGIVTSVSLDHATPAAFYARRPDRKMHYEISLDMVNSGFDFFGGGGLLDPSGKNSINPRGDVFEKAVKKGYRIVKNKKEFMSLPKNSGKIIAVSPRRQKKEALPYRIDRRENDISLAEFIRKAIELLDNQRGFFLMAEGGEIDWAAHANDAATLIQEVLALDEALKEAWKFYQKRPDETLIVVTADHETGGLGLGFAGTKYDSFFDVLKNQKISFETFSGRLAYYRETHPQNYKFEDLLPAFKMYFGLCVKQGGIMNLKDYEADALKAAFAKSVTGARFKPGGLGYLLYGEASYDPLTVVLTRVLARKAGVSWTTYAHTGSPILTSALGVGAETFDGYYDNTDIPKKIMAVMKGQ